MILKIILILISIATIQCISTNDEWKIVNSQDKDIIKIAKIAVEKIDIRSNSLFISSLLYINETKIKVSNT